MAPLKKGLSNYVQTRDEQSADDARTLTRDQVIDQAGSEYAQAGRRAKGVAKRRYTDVALRAEGMPTLSASEAEPMRDLQRTYNSQTARWEYK